MGETRAGKRCITDLYGDRIVAVDEGVNALQEIDVFHHQVHEGKAYIASYRFGSVGDDATANFMIQLDSTAYDFHLDIDCFCGGDAYVDIYEDCTHTDGTSITERNLNRGSLNTPNMSVKHTVSNGAQGTKIAELYIPGGTGIAAIGRRAGMREELILDPIDHTKYEIAIVNKSGGAAEVAFRITWYEVEK